MGRYRLQGGGLRMLGGLALVGGRDVCTGLVAEIFWRISALFSNGRALSASNPQSSRRSLTRQS